MEINNVKNRFTRTRNVYKSTQTAQMALLNKINSGSFSQIGDLITLNDGTSLKVNEIPKLNVRLLNTAAAKNNIMDFGSSCYFKYTNSMGKSSAIFSMPNGGLCRPVSEDLDLTKYDKETERYIHFWNSLKAGHALMLPPGNHNLPSLGYSNDDIRGYLDEAGISKGFFSVRSGSGNSDFFYSNSDQSPIYRKDDYDLRYRTMTSSDFSYDKSVFNCLEPGTEITIAGEKYTLKDDYTLDIPYGTDIFDIQIPKHTHMNKAPTGMDCRA